MAHATPTLVLPVADSWWVLRPPGHGRWQFDLVGCDDDGRRFGRGWRLHTGRVRAEQVTGWGRSVHAPVTGRVVTARDGERDRRRLLPVRDVLASLLVRPLRHRDDPTVLAGNHVTIAFAGGTVLLAHLREGSVRVAAGDHVTAGEVVGEVGNSGNTVLPHLHLHVAAGDDPRQPAVPFVVERFAEHHDDGWRPREHAPLPTRRRRIRPAAVRDG